MYTTNTIRSFYEIKSCDFLDSLKGKINKDIQTEEKEYILNVDEDQYINSMIEKYSFQPLKIIKESEDISHQQKVKRKYTDIYYRNSREIEMFEFTIRYNFEGTPSLFKVQPNPHTAQNYEVSINEREHRISFKIFLQQLDPELFEREKSNAFNCAFVNLEKLNNNLVQFHSIIEEYIRKTFQEYKQNYIKENVFFAAINLKVDKQTETVFTVPTIKKISFPKPSVSNKKTFISEPTMAKEMYDDVLSVIYMVGKSMERKPSLYINKEEEHLRDIFVMYLENRYEGVSATGETFNRGGKTDILLKNSNDGTNLFVAECKYWHGCSEFLKAISQLFDRYLTWRDSKTALILFVQNKEFSTVLRTVSENIKDHPYYIKENGYRGESSFSYIFCLPQDKEKQVLLEVILFHFDK